MRRGSTSTTLALHGCDIMTELLHLFILGNLLLLMVCWEIIVHCSISYVNVILRLELHHQASQYIFFILFRLTAHVFFS